MKKHNNLKHGEFIKCEIIIGGFSPYPSVFPSIEDWQEERKKHGFDLYQCEKCDLLSTTKGELSKHMTEEHTNSICQICKIIYSSGYLLEELKCDDCSFLTTKKNTMIVQQKNYHYKCFICNDTFK